VTERTTYRDDDLDPAVELEPAAEYETLGATDVDLNTAQDEDLETAEIRADIEATREEMSGTLGAIGEKLDPGRIVNQAKDTVREATIGRVEDAVATAGETARGAGTTMLETIKQNPIPAALAGIGLGWLFMNSRNVSSRRPTYYQGYQSRGGYYGGTRDWERGYEGDQGGVGGAVGRVGDTAGNVAGQAQERAGQLASEVQDRASQVASRAQYQAEQAQDEFQRMLNETPLAVGALAFALGAATGLVVPATRQEQQFMGEARDTLVERAQEMAQETMQKVQRVAQEVTEEAKDTAQREAKNEGLTQQ